MSLVAWLRARPVLGAGLALYTALGLALWFVCDDAWISFRYGRMWAEGHGVRFNLGTQPPVEGYTNFGWVALAAVCERAGLPVWVVLPALSLLCGAVLVVLVHRTAEGLGLDRRAADLSSLVLATSPIMVVWATGGLATMPFALLIFLCFERLVLHDDRVSLVHAVAAGIGLALLRFEGIGWVWVLGTLGAFVHGPSRSAAFLAATSLGWSPYMAWRTSAYEGWVPNTAVAKIGMSTGALLRGAKYVAMTALATLVPPLLYAGIPRATRRGRPWIAVATMAAAVPVYAVVVGGDFMAMGRLLVPAMPFAALLFALEVDALLRRGRVARRLGMAGGLLVAVGLLPLTGVTVVPEGWRQAVSVRHGPSSRSTELGYWASMRGQAREKHEKGLALRTLVGPDATMVAGAIGAVGYTSGLTIYDEHGLVTPEVARRPSPPDAHRRMPGHEKHVAPTFFLDRQPAILRAKITLGVADGAPPPHWVRKELCKVGITAPVRREYLPELHPWKDGWVLLVRRAEPGDDPEPAWRRWYGDGC